MYEPVIILIWLHVLAIIGQGSVSDICNNVALLDFSLVIFNYNCIAVKFFYRPPNKSVCNIYYFVLSKNRRMWGSSKGQSIGSHGMSTVTEGSFTLTYNATKVWWLSNLLKQAPW